MTVKEAVRPDRKFNPRTIGGVWTAELRSKVANAIAEVTGDEDFAIRKTNGEFGRLMGLTGFHEWFYNGTGDLLAEAGVKMSKVTEIASSFATHLAFWRHVPEQYHGYDIDRQVTEAAPGVLDVLKENGQLPAEGKYAVHNSADVVQVEKGDVAYAVLAAQYIEPKYLAAWVLGNGQEAAVVGDVCHGVSPASREEIAQLKSGGTISLRTDKYGDVGETGINIARAEGEVKRGILGEVIPAAISLDGKTYDGSAEGDVVRVPIKTSPEKDKGKGAVTVTEIDGVTYVLPWAMVPKENASEADIRGMETLMRTLIDVYRGEEAWDGNAAAVIPAAAGDYAGETGQQVTVFSEVRTLNDGPTPVSPKLWLSILNRHRSEIGRLAAQGSLSHVGRGEGKIDLKSFFGLVDRWTMPNMGTPVEEVFDYSNPPLLCHIMTKSAETAAKISDQILTQ